MKEKSVHQIIGNLKTQKLKLETEILLTKTGAIRNQLTEANMGLISIIGILERLFR